MYFNQHPGEIVPAANNGKAYVPFVAAASSGLPDHPSSTANEPDVNMSVEQAMS